MLGPRTKSRIRFYGGTVALLAGAAAFATVMPGRSFRGDAPLTARETAYEPLLRAHVTALAGTIGERHTRLPAKLRAAADYLTEALRSSGYTVHEHPYVVDLTRSVTLDADLPGTTPGDILVVGAHYDSATGAPGADDNGSGAAAVLALAHAMFGRPLRTTVRFALFANEEPPYFATRSMGSLVYAEELKARGDHIVGMLSLESIGYFSDQPGSQRYPGAVSLFYPDRGDFVAFVSNLSSRSFLRDAVRAFRREAHVPSEGGALPAGLPGVDWSDQRSFWAIGVPALMVTDTAIFRNPNYHQPTDRPDTVDYPRFTRVVAGLEDVIVDLASL